MKTKQLLNVSSYLRKLTILLILVSCSRNEHDLKHRFIVNQIAFESLIEEIYKNIEPDIQGKGSGVLGFTLTKEYSPYKNIRYIKSISNKMKKLGIVKVSCVTSLESSCGRYNELYLQLEDDNYPREKVVYFLYDKCGKTSNFKSKRISQIKINEYWSIYTDKS